MSDLFVRPYEPGDRQRLVEINHAQRAAFGMPFPFPDPDDPLNFVTLVGESGGRVVAAGTGRAVTEAYLTLDPAWADPAARWQAIRALIRGGACAARRAGFREIHAPLEPEMHYGKRLARELGFLADERSRLILDLRGGNNR